MEASNISARWLASDRKDWNWALGSYNLTRITATASKGRVQDAGVLLGKAKTFAGRDVWKALHGGEAELLSGAFYSIPMLTGKRWG